MDLGIDATLIDKEAIARRKHRTSNVSISQVLGGDFEQALEKPIVKITFTTYKHVKS